MRCMTNAVLRSIKLEEVIIDRIDRKTKGICIISKKTTRLTSSIFINPPHGKSYNIGVGGLLPIGKQNRCRYRKFSYQLVNNPKKS